MAWNWQLSDWRKFSYEIDHLHHFEDDFLRCSSEALGALRHIEKDGVNLLHVDIIREEAIQTSQIEGEFLDRESVQSWLRRHFGLQTKSTNNLLKEKGISDLLIDVYENYDEPLSHELFQR
jgi:Fic family protein